MIDQKEKELCYQCLLDAFKELKPAFERAGYSDIKTLSDMDSELSTFDWRLAMSYLYVRKRVLFRLDHKLGYTVEQALAGCTQADYARGIRAYVEGSKELMLPRFFGKDANIDMCDAYKALSRNDLERLLEDSEDWRERAKLLLKDPPFLRASLDKTLHRKYVKYCLEAC